MSNMPARRSPGLIGMIGSLITRALRFVEPVEFVAGSDFTSDSPVSQSYPTKNSMSAMAAFPWVRACIVAKADDISGLPIRVMRDGAEVENHPIAEILKQPATRTTWREWVRQSVVDYELCGNHYSIVQGGQSLLRMHPQRVQPVAQPDGQIQGYRYNGEHDYAWEDVVHVRNASWSDGIEEVLGEGSIRALHADLTADLAAKQMTAATAKRGRLEGVFTPKDPETAWGTALIARFKLSIQEWANSGTGYLVLGGAADFQPVSATPRDLEFAEQRSDTRDATLAVFSVPPARLSLPTANFATQAQQMRTYWESLRGGPAAALADALSWLARRHGQPGDSVEFDFSGIEALQEGMTSRLDRVGSHILFGMPPAAAYEMEGIPVPDGVFTVAAPVVDGADVDPDAVPDESEAAVVSEVSLNGAQIQSAIAIVSLVAAGQLPRATGLSMLVQFFGLTEQAAEDIMGDIGISFFIEEEDVAARSLLRQSVHRRIMRLVKMSNGGELRRMDMWRGFLNAVHAPSERALQLATARYLKGALKRYAARMDASGHKSMTKALSAAQIDAILAESTEIDEAIKALGGAMKSSLLRAFRAAIVRMGLSITWNPAGSILHEATRAAAVQITTTQSNVLRSLLSLLNEGATINEVQASMMASHAFSATRALRIARTEATRFVNAGADQAYEQAAQEGVNVQKQWLSARDGHVRDAHRSLDGQTVDVGGQFTAPGGATASFPGGFGSAALDINCRCTTIPVLGDNS